MLHLAISKVVQFDNIGSNVFGFVSALCILAQVDLDYVSLLSHESFMDFKKWEMLIMPRPSSFLPVYLVVLSTTEGLLSDKKCSNSLSISLICVTVRLAMTVAMCVNLGIQSALII